MGCTYTLTDGRLIDLDGLDSSLFEVNDFVTESKGELPGLHLLGNIGTREGPVEDSDRTGEHTLHWLLGQALSVAAPFDSHRTRAADVGDDDRRADITEERIFDLADIRD